MFTPSKKIELETNMENLPSEMLCIIFSFLDKKSRKSATATCQLWFDAIRNDSNSSNHICYTKGFQELQCSIKDSEWNWERWPALKTFELQGRSGKEDLLNDLPIDFKQCPTLKTVIFDAWMIDKPTDIADLFPNCQRYVATIRKFAFNPQLDISTQFGADHIWSLKIWDQNDEVFKMINENVKGLKELSVRNLSYLNNLVCMDALLELDIDDIYGRSSELKIAGLKKLETLKVRKLAELDKLVGMDALLELSVTDVSGHALKEYDLSNFAKRFKNLQKCDICVTYGTNSIQPKEYAEIVQDVFQNSATRVEIIFSKSKSSPTYLTKEPFQKCVVKKENSDDSDLDSDVSESDD